MAQLETLVYTAISGNGAVAAVVSTRIYPMVLPQDVTLPAVTYQRISGGQVNTLDGYSGLERPRIQVDAWATTYSAAKDLAGKIVTAMASATTFSSTVENDTDFYEDDTKIYRVSVDFMCWNAP